MTTMMNLNHSRQAGSRLLRAQKIRCTISCRGKHTLPKLAYAYNALEPHISKDIMELHHSKHHQTYVNGLNTAEEQIESAFKAGDTKKQISLQAAIKFNGGGHINHTLFWSGLAPEAEGGGKLEGGSLKDAIDKDFGGLEKFQKTFTASAAGIQGSGWAWLGYNQSTGKLEIVTTKDQDPLLSHVPIIGLDMWEHAFYLQYKNVKPSYINAAFNVINWKEGQERYQSAMS